MGKLVNKVELAEILGVSERTLTTWQEEPAFPFVERGELRGQEHTYDTAAVMGWWLQREIGKASPSEEERRRLVTAQAHLAELKLAQLRGKVVDADDIARETRRCAREVRDHLLQLPYSVAPVVANERSPEAIIRILDREIRRALTSLATHLEARAAAADNTQPAEAINET